MTRGGPDYIADPRLSQLEFDKLQTYMLLLAVEDPGARKDGTSSAIQGARTRFALATLAEARGWSLEDLLLEWVGPPVVVEGGGTAKAPGAAPPTESKDETPGTNAPPSYRAPYDVAHVPTTPLDEELAEATRRAEEMMREAEEASAYSSHSRIVAETALREYNALLDTVDVAHFGTRNLLDRSKAKAEQAAALAVAAAEAAADAEDMQAAATREMHAVGAARHQVMVEERAATTAIHFEAEARRQKQRMDEAAAKANTAAAATRAAREAKQAEEAKAAAEAAAKARAEEAEAMAKLAAESAAIRADGDVQRKKWEKEAEAVRRAEMLAARSAARRSKYEPPPFIPPLATLVTPLPPSVPPAMPSSPPSVPLAMSPSPPTVPRAAGTPAKTRNVSVSRRPFPKLSTPPPLSSPKRSSSLRRRRRQTSRPRWSCGPRTTIGLLGRRTA